LSAHAQLRDVNVRLYWDAMRVEWTDEQEFLREAVAGVVAREAEFTTVRKWTEAGDVAPADELAVRQGWTGIGLDEELGGQGGGTLELAVLAEQLGRGAVPWDRTLAGCLAAPVLARAGAHELAAAIAEGERVAVLAVDGRAPLAPVALAAGVVFSGSVGPVLRAYEARTGQLLARFQMPGAVNSGATPVGTMVFVGSGSSSTGHGGGVHAFRLP
jgi:hypothetical protein